MLTYLRSGTGGNCSEGGQRRGYQPPETHAMQVRQLQQGSRPPGYQPPETHAVQAQEVQGA